MRRQEGQWTGSRSQALGFKKVIDPQAEMNSLSILKPQAGVVGILTGPTRPPRNPSPALWHSLPADRHCFFK